MWTEEAHGQKLTHVLVMPRGSLHTTKDRRDTDPCSAPRTRNQCKGDTSLVTKLRATCPRASSFLPPLCARTWRRGPARERSVQTCCLGCYEKRYLGADDALIVTTPPSCGGQVVLCIISRSRRKLARHRVAQSMASIWLASLLYSTLMLATLMVATL